MGIRVNSKISKYFFLTLFITLLAIFTIGCSKQKGEVSSDEDGTEDSAQGEVTIVKIESQSSTIESVMVGGSFWSLNPDGYMEWVRDVPAGTAVGAYRNQDSTESFPAEIKRNALRSSDWARRNFIHVLYNSADYWVQDLFLVIDAKPAVVIGNGAFLYNSATDSASSGRWVAAGTELAVLNSTQTQGDAEQKMTAVSVYLRDYGLIPNKFIPSESISTNKDDITAMHIMQRLGQRSQDGRLLIQDGVVRRELKEVAGRLNISNAVRARINNY